MRHVKAALRCARHYGMELEFKAFYRIYRSSGVTPWMAAWYALNDWDLLDIDDSLGLTPSLTIGSRWYGRAP